MLYTQPETSSADTSKDKISVLNETFHSPDQGQPDSISVLVHLEKGATMNLSQDSGRITVKVDQSPAGPVARVFVLEGSVSWKTVNVHIFLKDGSRLLQSLDI